MMRNLPGIILRAIQSEAVATQLRRTRDANCLQVEEMPLSRWRNRTRAILILEAIACMKTDRAFAQAAVRGVVASLVGAILCFTASASWAEEPLKLADSQLEPVKWTELAGWRTDDHLAAFAAYRTSCQVLRIIPRTGDNRPIHNALWNVCRKALDLQPNDSDTARTFFEQNFQPVRIARLGDVEGFLTGYFEPIVQGSRF